MKKFLVLASILLVLTLAFVACTETNPGEETTGETIAATDPATDAPTDVPTEAPTEEEPTEAPTEEQPTEAPTDKAEDPTEAPTEAPTEEPETLPYVDIDTAGKVGHSFDTFFTNGNMYFEQDGQAGDKLTAQDNLVVFKTGEPCQSLALRGWIGFSQAIDSFGYYVDTYDFVWGEFTQATEDGVKAAGGEHASRFMIEVPLVGLTTGEHKVGFVVKLADGTIAILREELTVAIEKTVWNGSGIVTHQSFDQLYTGTGNAENGPENIFTPGQSATWDYIANFGNVAYTDFAVTELTYWGWIGATGEALGQFGYQINGGAAIYNDEWAWATEQPVVDAAAGTGATVASRMKITINIAGLEGENIITVLYKNAEGTVVLGEFTLITPAKPTHYDNYNVPADQWVISGHRPALQDATEGMVAAGGVEFGALLHQGAIALGDIDLSKYSKVVIYYGIDNSQVTIDRHAANAANRIMLVSADTNMTNSPAEETIIAGANYEPTGWAVIAFEIDLTNIDYNGPVFVTYDTLPGTFMLISSIEFIGAEIDYSQPEEPETPDEPIGPEAPEYYEDVVIDLSQFADQPTYMPSFPEAGINVPLFNLGYTNYIAIGEMDLSKYSKVEITYSFDGSDVTLDNYNNASSHAIGLKSTPTSYGQVTDDNFDGDIAHADMEFAGGWTSYKTAVVDLSAVTYNGPVYVTMHNPKGTTIAISGVKFIGAEKTAEPETPVVPEKKPEVLHVSNDELRYLGADLNQIGQAFAPGQFAGWDGKITVKKGEVATFVDWGWVAMKDADSYIFGYIINGIEIYHELWAVEAGADILAACPAGTTAASRFMGTLAEAALAVGENNVKFVVKMNNTEVVVLREYTVIVTA